MANTDNKTSKNASRRGRPCTLCFKRRPHKCRKDIYVSGRELQKQGIYKPRKKVVVPALCTVPEFEDVQNDELVLTTFVASKSM